MGNNFFKEWYSITNKIYNHRVKLALNYRLRVTTAQLERFRSLKFNNFRKKKKKKKEKKTEKKKGKNNNNSNRLSFRNS
jgi:hypothetical protein